MSSVDRTNEEIVLSMESDSLWDGTPIPVTLTIDHDQDSSISPFSWVYISASHGDEINLRLTYDEACLAWQRLGLILGKDSA